MLSIYQYMGRSTRTKALSMCLIHLHLPSGERICKPAAGWLQRIVTLPKSDRGVETFLPSPDVARRTCVSLEPHIFGFLFFNFGTRVAINTSVIGSFASTVELYTYYFINLTDHLINNTWKAWVMSYRKFPLQHRIYVFPLGCLLEVLVQEQSTYNISGVSPVALDNHSSNTIPQYRMEDSVMVMFCKGIDFWNKRSQWTRMITPSYIAIN